MTGKDSNRTISEIKAMIAEDGDFLRPTVRTVIEEFLQAAMAKAVGAEKGKRAERRLSYRSGYYHRYVRWRASRIPSRRSEKAGGRRVLYCPRGARRSTWSP